MTGEPSSSRAESGAAKPYVNNRRTSVLLREYMASLNEPKASLGSLRDALGDRGFGVLLFIFALPNLIPVNIPLLSAVLGAPLVLLAAQLTYGRHNPWFPHWLARQSVSRQNFEAVVLRALPSRAGRRTIAAALDSAPLLGRRAPDRAGAPRTDRGSRSPHPLRQLASRLRHLHYRARYGGEGWACRACWICCRRLQPGRGWYRGDRPLARLLPASIQPCRLRSPDLRGTHCRG